MRKILKVAQREYIETVKTKTFLLSVFLTPLLVGIMLLFVGRFDGGVGGPQPPRTITVLDLSEQVAEPLTAVAAEYNASRPDRQIRFDVLEPPENPDVRIEDLKQQVRRGEIDALVVIDHDVLDDGDGARYYSFARTVADLEMYEKVYRLINEAVVTRRFEAQGVSPEIVSRLQRSIPVEQIDLSSKVEAQRDMPVMILVPFIFVFLMFTGVFGVGQGMLTSVIEEKSSRVMELLLSAVTPFQLMSGKILGLVGAGMTLMAIWGAGAYLVGAAMVVSDVVSAAMMLYFLVYFVLGFLVVSSLMAAVGAACNTLKEAQGLMAPLTVGLVVPMAAWFYIAQHPNGTFAIALSFIPPITPMVMVIRLAADPELAATQIAATIGLLVVSVPAVMWASAKIFRTGILMYGKPASIRELARWIRYR